MKTPSTTKTGGARPPDAAGGRYLGTPFRRVDARAKVTGRTRFVDDLVFPRMVHACLVRSSVPHGRLERVDCEPALRLPGVLATLTGEDLPIAYGILPVSQDEHALARDKVRFVGDPVAAVAALSEEQAQAAALAVAVDIVPLPTVAEIDEALLPTEDPLHDRSDEGNVHKRVAMGFGDCERGLAAAEQVFEDTFYYAGSTHLALEQHGAVAVPEDDERLTLYSSTQTPHYTHRTLARVLELPESRIRVVACPVGGGFGGKADPFSHEIVAAKLALLLGRPVKIVLNREEVFYCHRGRHPVLMHLRTGFDRDGRITAHHLRTVLDGGAYGSYGVASIYYTGALQTLCYRLPAYLFQGARCFTNKPPCGPKRGHGTPQPRFGLEVHLDKAAHSLGIDPAELRLRNLLPAGSVTANWLEVGTSGLERCIEAVCAGSGFRERHGRLPQGRGLGLACGAYLCGAGLPIYWNDLPHSGAQLLLDRSGRATAFCGEAEIGQGSDSVVAAIVAETLGIDLEDVRLCVADTDLTPVDLGSYSSRVTVMAGNAALEAAERARDLLAEAVADRLEVDAARLQFADGRVFDRDDPGRSVSFAEAVCAAEARHGTLATVGSYRPPAPAGRYRGSGVGPSPAYSFSAAVIEVAVDPDSGWVRVERVWIAHDIGRALNPALVLGQIEGGVYMGLGEALMEEQRFRRLPRHLSDALVHRGPSMLEYKSPTTLDMPAITTYLIEEPDPSGPFGAKEVGQGPLLPVPPAVANAVFDAVGVRIDELPIEPHKVLRALEAKERGREPRVGPGALPEVDFGETLIVPTPEEGGDGRAINEWRVKMSSRLRSAAGASDRRDPSHSEKRHAPLTTS